MTEPIVHDFKNMGIVKLWLDIRPDMHRKIAMVRQTGMKIMDRGNIIKSFMKQRGKRTRKKQNILIM